MAYLRTVPVAVHPGQDETFHSWCVRLAEAMNVEPLVALHAVGYIQQPRRRRADLTGYGLTLTDQAVSNICHTTRCTPEAIRATLLTVFDGGPISAEGLLLDHSSGIRELAHREWLHTGTTTACPECLERNGYQWQLTWRLPWTALCVDHRVFHAAVCPRCRKPLNAGGRPDGTLGPANANHRPDAGHCINSISPGRNPYAAICEHPHANLPAAPCQHPILLETQQFVDTLLTPGQRNKHNDWWRDARAVTATVLAHGTPDLIDTVTPGLPAVVADTLRRHYQQRDALDGARNEIIAAKQDHRTARRLRAHTQTPSDPALTAPAMTVAVAILADLNIHPEPLRCPQLLDNPYEQFAETLARRGVTTSQALRQRKASERLQHQTKARSGYNRLTQRTDSGSPTVDPDHIPRLWPAALYDDVRHLFAGTTDDYARQYLSLAAAKLTLRCTWAQAAEALHHDPKQGRKCANAVGNRLNTAGTSGQVHTHILETLRFWAQQPAGSLPDYRSLATELGQRNSLTEADWTQICRNAGTDLAGTPARRRNYIAWQWHTIALMPLNEWPGWRNCRNVENAKEVYRRFVRDYIPQLHPTSSPSTARR